MAESTDRMIDGPKRIVVTFVQAISIAGMAWLGATWINDRFNTIDRKFDRIDMQLLAISDRVSDPVSSDRLRQYFALLKAYNPTLNIPVIE